MQLQASAEVALGAHDGAEFLEVFLDGAADDGVAVEAPAFHFGGGVAKADLDLVGGSLAPGKIEAAAALVSVPALIRGYGHVRQASAEKAMGERARLLERLAKTGLRPELQAAE